jgi:hypothetical protein
MNNGHLLKRLTEPQVVAMYKEGRLPNGWIADDETPNELHPIENVLEVKVEHSDNYETLSETNQKISEIQKKNFQWEQNYGIPLQIGAAWLILIIIVVPIILLFIHLSD